MPPRYDPDSNPGRKRSRQQLILEWLAMHDHPLFPTVHSPMPRRKIPLMKVNPRPRRKS